MARRKNVNGVTQEAETPSIPDKPKARREVVYTIVIPGCDDRVKIEHARNVLKELYVREAQIHIDGDTVSCPRLFTFWRGDKIEAEWQQEIKAKLPTTIIDVADWTPAPGYPKGDLSL